VELKYTYIIDDEFYVGHLDDYPEYTTQGENLEDFEQNLLDIYEMIQDGTLEVKEHKGILQIKAAG
jgi:predicted RNase H-like HicB family nuclease